MGCLEKYFKQLIFLSKTKWHIQNVNIRNNVQQNVVLTTKLLLLHLPFAQTVVQCTSTTQYAQNAVTIVVNWQSKKTLNRFELKQYKRGLLQSSNPLSFLCIFSFFLFLCRTYGAWLLCESLPGVDIHVWVLSRLQR